MKAIAHFSAQILASAHPFAGKSAAKHDSEPTE